MTVSMPPVFIFNGKIFYFDSIRVKIDDYADGYRLTIK